MNVGSIDYQEIRQNILQGPRMNSLLGSFERIASGNAQKPHHPVEAEQEFLRRSPEYQRHDSILRPRTGTFYRHLLASIPYALEEFTRVDSALLKLAELRGATYQEPLTYWETSAADGTRARALAEYSAGRFLTLTDSPNEGNRNEFAALDPHPHSFFHCGCWADITPEFLAAQKMHPAFRKHFDIIWENTTFQMYGNNRADQLAYIKRVLKPGGLAIFCEKMNQPDKELYDRAEHVKDSLYKSRYFSPQELQAKRKDILEVMENGQVTLGEFIGAAQGHFKCGAVIWNSTNFYEIVATDAPESLDDFLSVLPDPFVPEEFIFERPMVRRLW